MKKKIEPLDLSKLSLSQLKTLQCRYFEGDRTDLDLDDIVDEIDSRREVSKPAYRKVRHAILRGGR